MLPSRRPRDARGRGQPRRPVREGLPYTTLDNKKYFYRLLTALARTADHIVTVSEYSRRDIVEHLGVDERRVTNTYQHHGFWQPMDTLRDKIHLEELWQSGKAPWKVWP